MKRIFAIISILAIGLLTACAGEQDEALFGTWRWDADGAYSYFFNYDGTGERGFSEVRETFTWSTSGDRLNINRDRAGRREIRNEVWTYEIRDGILTIASRQAANTQHSYFADELGQYGPLIGEWSWDADESFLYVFNADGTGTRGFPADPFTWTTSGDRLNILRERAPHGEIRGEIWTFTISNGALTITSLQEIGMEFSYQRVN